MASLRRVVTAVAVGITLLMAGCAQVDPAGQPTYSCTPDDGSSPYACYKVQYDAKAKEAAQYAEAEAVYRKYLAEDERINRIGGVSEPTPVLLETTAGDFLENVMANYRALKDAQATAVGGQYKVAWLKRMPRTDTLNGSVVAITACVDARTIQVGSKRTHPKPGLVLETTAYFAPTDDLIKITASRYKEVTQC